LFLSLKVLKSQIMALMSMQGKSHSCYIGRYQ
jgi:hypothetical protein